MNVLLLPGNHNLKPAEACAWVRADQSLHGGEWRGEEQAQKDMRVEQGLHLRASQAIHLACNMMSSLWELQVWWMTGSPSISSFTV